MLEFSASGTLGDTYIQVLQIMTFGDIPIKVYHYTKCTYWYDQIQEIYSLLPNVEVEFVDKKRDDLVELESTDKTIPRVYFPDFKMADWGYMIDGCVVDYIVIQCHSGKDVGGNVKKFSKEHLNDFISIINKYSCNKGVVLIGTNPEYLSFEDGCLNLVGKTNILELVPIIKNATNFIGPEGFGSFVALSHKVPSTIFYTSREAVEKRIIGTPWEEYCRLKFMKDSMI